MGILGKKVFFLYPPSVIREELITRLLEEEYEIYMLKNPDDAKRLLRKFSDSIVFINIDEGLTEKEWETWIRDIQSDKQTGQVGIGILSYNNDDELRKKYLMDIGIQCGYIHMKLSLEEATKILLKTLRANEAKGRRKYLRVDCQDDHLSSINIRVDGNQINGTIRDISIVGLSCTFEQEAGLPKNALLKDIQLKLRGTLIKADAIVFGNRSDGLSTIYVLLFTKTLSGPDRQKIRRYIQTTLQNSIKMNL